jgi:hypothetical protein
VTLVLRAVVVGALLGPAPALAITPVMACDGALESNMRITEAQPLGGPTSGAVVEGYGMAAMSGEDGAFEMLPAPAPELRAFRGTRVTACDTGEFLAVGAQGPKEVGAALAATEFLRDAIQGGQRVGFDDIRRAAEAVYGPVLVMRETAQTCACHAYFDELRPDEQTPFPERTDAEW